MEYDGEEQCSYLPMRICSDTTFFTSDVDLLLYSVHRNLTRHQHDMTEMTESTAWILRVRNIPSIFGYDDIDHSILLLILFARKKRQLAG
jgi:hypothetical protein